jgi:hypothetical protein
MSYSIDFAKVTLEQYKKELEKRTLIPSRQILKDKADIHFNEFKKANIKTLEELFSVIKNGKTKAELLRNKNISDEYLAILLRELKSIQPKPLKLKEFPWISSNTINKIEKNGISNTQILYEKLGKSNERKKFVKSTGIDEQEIVELLKLSDLTRIQWVNSTFAHILFIAGFDTVKKVSKASPEELFEKVTLANEEMRLYKGNIGLNDMKLCIEAAKMIDAEIEV